MRHLRALIRLMALVVWVTALSCIGIFTYVLARRSLHPKMVMLCNRGELWIAGVKVECEGTPPDDPKGVLFVANHCSYLDIPVYGSLLPVCYTPKAEIRYWPVIGQLAVLAGCVFIRREKDAAAGQRRQLLNALGTGLNILLFPEGTTNDGENIKPFKTALFSVAEPREGEVPVPIQGVALRYAVEGKPPASGRMLDRVAWYGDMTLVPHLWALLSMRRVVAHVTFLPSIAWEGNRKDMAAKYEATVREAITLSVREVASTAIILE